MILFACGKTNMARRGLAFNYKWLFFKIILEILEKIAQKIFNYFDKLRETTLFSRLLILLVFSRRRTKICWRAAALNKKAPVVPLSAVVKKTVKLQIII